MWSALRDYLVRDRDADSGGLHHEYRLTPEFTCVGAVGAGLQARPAGSNQPPLQLWTESELLHLHDHLVVAKALAN